MRPTIMKVSTNAIAHNARLFREAIPKQVRMMCVIKADAYGHGAVAAAQKLLSAGADAFAVAMVEEAEKKSCELKRVASQYVDEIIRRAESTLNDALTTVRQTQSAFQGTNPLAAAPAVQEAEEPEEEDEEGWA